MIKIVAIWIIACLAVLDVLLILGCAKLEKMRGEDDERFDKEEIR